MAMPPDSTPRFSPFTRRDALKVASMGAASFLVGPYLPSNPEISEQQGRVIDTRIGLFERPSYSSKRIRDYWKDMVLALTAVTIGDDEPFHNRVWYRLEDQGWAHSSAIQPVRTQLNEPDADIPSHGALAEVSVPFTDAHTGPGKEYPVAYRYYYETTHWVLALVRSLQGEAWYHILEDRWENEYYAPARHMRLILLEDLAPLSPNVPASAKRLEVHTRSQVVIAYEWERVVFMARASTGTTFRNGDFSTPPGRYQTFHKRPSRHMAAGNLALNGYDLPGVPWITYFTESGIAFHGTYWHNNFGKASSHGCINVTAKTARWLYRWTDPVVPSGEKDLYVDFGTQVDVL